mmetsp:Transcript_19225/g.50537  ORF Transcript_19225/g.50537 Transcript_19225/m.50537 type:complete len:375 (-) Transcript_19225:36-1160(-)
MCCPAARKPEYAAISVDARTTRAFHPLCKVWLDAQLLARLQAFAAIDLSAAASTAALGRPPEHAMQMRAATTAAERRPFHCERSWLSTVAGAEDESPVAQLRERHLEFGAVTIAQRHLDGIHRRHRPGVIDALALLVDVDGRAALKGVAVAVQLLPAAIKVGLRAAAVAQVVAHNRRGADRVTIGRACDLIEIALGLVRREAIRDVEPRQSADLPPLVRRLLRVALLLAPRAEARLPRNLALLLFNGVDQPRFEKLHLRLFLVLSLLLLTVEQVVDVDGLEVANALGLRYLRLEDLVVLREPVDEQGVCASHDALHLLLPGRAGAVVVVVVIFVRDGRLVRRRRLRTTRHAAAPRGRVVHPVTGVLSLACRAEA